MTMSSHANTIEQVLYLFLASSLEDGWLRTESIRGQLFSLRSEEKVPTGKVVLAAAICPFDRTYLVQPRKMEAPNFREPERWICCAYAVRTRNQILTPGSACPFR